MREEKKKNITFLLDPIVLVMRNSFNKEGEQILLSLAYLVDAVSYLPKQVKLIGKTNLYIYILKFKFRSFDNTNHSTKRILLFS